MTNKTRARGNQDATHLMNNIIMISIASSVMLVFLSLFWIHNSEFPGALDGKAGMRAMNTAMLTIAQTNSKNETKKSSRLGYKGYLSYAGGGKIDPPRKFGKLIVLVGAMWERQGKLEGAVGSGKQVREFEG
jgi:hypothetical protein